MERGGRPRWVHLNCAIAAGEVGGNSPAAHNKVRSAIFVSKTVSRTRSLFDNNFLQGKGTFSKCGLLKYFPIILIFFQSDWYVICKTSQNPGLYYAGDPWIVFILLVLLLFVCRDNEWDASDLSFSSSSDLDGNQGTNLKLVEIKKILTYFQQFARFCGWSGVTALAPQQKSRLAHRSNTGCASEHEPVLSNTAWRTPGVFFHIKSHPLWRSCTLPHCHETVLF